MDLANELRGPATPIGVSSLSGIPAEGNSLYSTPQTSCGAQRFASVPASAGPILSLDETHDCPRPRSPGLDDLGSYALYRSRSRSYRAQCDRFPGISMSCPLHAFGASDEHVPVLIELDEEGGSRVARASVERCLVTRRHPSATRLAIPMAIARLRGLQCLGTRPCRR